MFQIVTKEFIKNFNELNGRCADIQIKHALYGNQKIKRCVLHPFIDGERIGLHINEEDIYITIEELRGIGVGNSQFIIKSELMELCIKLL